MSSQPYPMLTLGALDELAAAYKEVSRLRFDDINDFSNLPNVYMRGRKVGKIPGTSGDVADTDRVGDFSFASDGSYMYILIDNAGTPEWRRFSGGTF